MKRTYGKPLMLWLGVVLGGMACTAASCAENRAPESELCPGAYPVKVPSGLDAAQQNSYSVPVWQQAGQRDRVVGLASGRELVEVASCRGDWCRVRWRGKSGWLPKDSLEEKETDDCHRKSKPESAAPKPVPATPWAIWMRRLVRTNPTGDMECLANDGRNCDYDRTLDDPLLKSARPPTLACGEDYREKHGYTGYDTPGHWCWQLGEKLKPEKLVDWIWGDDDGIFVFWRIGPAGEPECASRNGKDCLWGNRNMGDAITDSHPLQCGARHKEKWGITGYESKEHWCYRLAARYAPDKLK